jgi:hypothetical protein
MLHVTELANERHDIETELVIGQREMGFGLRPVREEEPGTIGIAAASYGEDQPHDPFESRDRPEVLIVGMESALALGAVLENRRQAQTLIGLRTRTSLAHDNLLGKFSRPFYVLSPS